MIIWIFLAFLKLYKFLGNICSFEQLFYRKKSPGAPVLFIQNILPFLIVSNPPANFS